MQDEPDLIDFSEISPELSRDFRGLRIWLPMKLHGAEVFRQALDEKLDLADWATRELRTIDNMEIVAEPQLSIVAFRLRPPHLDEAALTDLNRELREHRINAKQRVFRHTHPSRGSLRHPHLRAELSHPHGSDGDVHGGHSLVCRRGLGSANHLGEGAARVILEMALLE